MKCAARFLQRYAEADWIARLVLTTCFAAALNFGDIFTETLAASQAAGTRIVDGYEITVCYYGPPPAFRPRFFVLLALVLATLGAFKKTVGCRVFTSVGLAGSLTIYIC